jgi:transitional endoplasmic reticulum ATPase
VEDVFADADPGPRRSSAPRSKAWINRTLEENPVPAFWLSNSVGCIDPAFIRRFDMVLEVPVPPQAQRQKIATTLCADLLDQNEVRIVSEQVSLAPAVVARSASVVRCMMEDGGFELSRADALFHLVSGTLVAQGHTPIPRGSSDLPEIYDPGFINADIDPVRLVEGLRSARAARLCLYGPPGTGKTAFGRWLARQMDMRLRVVRASDLLSKWVGGTERNIAGVFQEAQSDEALLLIDEIDSLLADRRTAQRPWEVSSVNEMLTQMESYKGILVASTNLMDALDSAAARRFDIKLKLDFLKPQQAALLFTRLCKLLELEVRDDLAQRVSLLENLTPGDFAVIERQHRFRPFPSAAELVSALDAEVDGKLLGGSRIGFI